MRTDRLQDLDKGCGEYRLNGQKQLSYHRRCCTLSYKFKLEIMQTIESSGVSLYGERRMWETTIRYKVPREHEYDSVAFCFKIISPRCNVKSLEHDAHVSSIICELY